MSYATILIGSTPYPTYADADEAADYVLAALHSAPWDDAEEATRAKALVTATRLLDRQHWVGKKTDEDQALAWPRTGVDNVDDDVIPTDIEYACIELALALLDGSDVQDSANTVEKLSSMTAGSVSLTFYHGADGSPRRFPQIVTELVAKYLGGGTTLIGSSSGTDTESVTDNDLGLSRGF